MYACVCCPGRKALTYSFYQCLGERQHPAGSVEPAQVASAYKEAFQDVSAFAEGPGAAHKPDEIFALDLNHVEV